MPPIGTVQVVSNIERGPGSVVTNDFLTTVSNNFLKISKQYCDELGEFPFCFKEKQTQSILACAIQQTTSTFLGEAPVVRRNLFDDDNSHGWVDFWASYRNTSYFIEVKHSFYSIKNENVPNQMTNKWKTANDQLAKAKEELAQNWSINAIKYLVSLMVIPFYSQLRDDDVEIQLPSDETLNNHNNLIFGSLQPNWSSFCIIHNAYAGPYEYTKTRELHPALGIYAHAKSIS